MAVTLTVTDVANGGGVICNVTGTGTIDVDAFYPGGAGWVTLGQRSGDGTLSITTGRPGVFWFIAHTATEFSSIVTLYVARDGQAVFDKCLQAIYDTLELNRAGGAFTGANGMGVEGVDRQRILRCDALKVNQPAMVVVPGNPSLQPISNENDEVVYPCYVFLVNTEPDQADDDEGASIPYHLIHQRTWRLFSQQRLDGVTEIANTRVVLGNLFEWQRQYQQLQGVITVECVARRQPRGA